MQCSISSLESLFIYVTAQHFHWAGADIDANLYRHTHTATKLRYKVCCIKRN